MNFAQVVKLIRLKDSLKYIWKYNSGVQQNYDGCFFA